MKKALVLFMLALPILNAPGQTLPKNDPLKLDADYYLMDKDFKKALTNYLNVLKSESDNADIKYKVGICYLNSETEKGKAIPYLEEAVLKISEKYNPNSFKETNAPADALFLLGSAYRINNQLDAAMDAYSRYKNYLDPKDSYNLNVVEQYLKNCNLAKTMQNNPVNMTSVNLGSPLNTNAANYNAVVSGDGKTLFYTSPARQGYDIFMCTYGDSTWSLPRNLTSVLGSGKYMLTSDLSMDGQTLLLTQEDPLNSDIYVSHLVKGRWSKAEPLPKEINSKYNETHASFSPDGKTLYFTSDRKGGQGDLDIYKTTIDIKGEWGKAENLGLVVNTPYNEETPFIAENGDKLFFSSEGHDGMGGFDIFYYDFSNPAAGVVNLGFPINSTDNDLFFVPTGDGTSAYYAFAGKDSYGERDIYRINIFPPAEPEEQQQLAEAAPVSIAEEPQQEAVTLPVDTLASSVAEEEKQRLASADSLALQQQLAMAAEEERQRQLAAEEESERQKQLAAAAEEERQKQLAAAEVEERQKQLETAAEDEQQSLPEAAGNTSLATGKSYKIQIMALKKPVDFKNFGNMPGIVVSYKGDSWYRYTLGNLPSRNEAEDMLSSIVSRGYRDAFIKANNLYPQFTIQVMAVPGPVIDLDVFSNLSDVYVTKGPDSFCRYTTGEFTSKEEAQTQLSKIKSIGYSEAFVTRIK